MKKVHVDGILLGLCVYVGLAFGLDMDDFLITGSTTLRGCCEDGWIGYRGSCYVFVNFHRYNVEEAKRYCSRIRSNLVEIGAEWENSFLKEYSRHFSKNGIQESFWTGGSDAEQFESWTWENSLAALTFTDWAPRQPTNTGHCLKMAGDKDYSWQVERCSKKEFFICERNLF